MSDGGGAAAASAMAVHAAMMNAVRSFGVIVTTTPEEFQELVQRQDAPLVVYSVGGIFVNEYRYLMSYKGLVFFTKSAFPLDLPHGAEVVHAAKLMLPT